MRSNKRKSIQWKWCMDCAALALEDGEALGSLVPHFPDGYTLHVQSARSRIAASEVIKIKIPGKQLEDKAMARVRFHLSNIAKESAKASRAEARRFKMFQARSGK